MKFVGGHGIIAYVIRDCVTAAVILFQVRSMMSYFELFRLIFFVYIVIFKWKVLVYIYTYIYMYKL